MNRPGTKVPTTSKLPNYSLPQFLYPVDRQCKKPVHVRLQAQTADPTCLPEHHFDGPVTDGLLGYVPCTLSSHAFRPAWKIMLNIASTRYFRNVGGVWKS